MNINYKGVIIQHSWMTDADGEDVRDQLRERGIPFYEQKVGGFLITGYVSLLHYSKDGVGKSILVVCTQGADSFYEEYYLFPRRVHPAEVSAELISYLRQACDEYWRNNREVGA